jgi:hypothetical protein
MEIKKDINIPNADTFQNLINTKLTDSASKDFMQFHNRVQFKLYAARYFLERLKKLEQKAGSLVGPGIERDEVELNLDAFLYDVVGAFDTLLQEINVAFGLGLAVQDVCVSAIIQKLPDGKVKKTLGTLNGNTNGWFWMLREYRNHSAHRSIIIRHMILIADGSRPRVYLANDPRDPDKGHSNEEVVPYCSHSLKNMEEAIDEIYEQCQIELVNRP